MKHVSQVPADVREYLRRRDGDLERNLDVTFVEMSVVGNSLELIHPYSGARRVVGLPKGKDSGMDLIQWMHEQASAFVKDVVKPNG